MRPWARQSKGQVERSAGGQRGPWPRAPHRRSARIWGASLAFLGEDHGVSGIGVAPGAIRVEAAREGGVVRDMTVPISPKCRARGPSSA